MKIARPAAARAPKPAPERSPVVPAAAMARLPISKDFFQSRALALLAAALGKRFVTPALSVGDKAALNANALLKSPFQPASIRERACAWPGRVNPARMAGQPAICTFFSK